LECWLCLLGQQWGQPTKSPFCLCNLSVTDNFCTPVVFWLLLYHGWVVNDWCGVVTLHDWLWNGDTLPNFAPLFLFKRPFQYIVCAIALINHGHHGTLPRVRLQNWAAACGYTFVLVWWLISSYSHCWAWVNLQEEVAQLVRVSRCWSKFCLLSNSSKNVFYESTMLGLVCFNLQAWSGQKQGYWTSLVPTIVVCTIGTSDTFGWICDWITVVTKQCHCLVHTCRCPGIATVAGRSLVTEFTWIVGLLSTTSASHAISKQQNNYKNGRRTMITYRASTWLIKLWWLAMS